MAFTYKGCAVQGCTLAAASPDTLCIKHRLPGVVVRVGDNDYVITVWAAKHGNEEGIILLNDLALGELFGGRAGFDKKLQDQGFVDVRNIPTDDEVRSIMTSDKEAEWSGHVSAISWGSRDHRMQVNGGLC